MSQLFVNVAKRYKCYALLFSFFFFFYKQRLLSIIDAEIWILSLQFEFAVSAQLLSLGDTCISDMSASNRCNEGIEFDFQILSSSKCEAAEIARSAIRR